MADTPNASSAHKTLVSFGLMLVVMVFMVEAAGHSKASAEVVFLLLFGIVMLLAIQYSSRFASFTQSYPWTPPQ